MTIAGIADLHMRPAVRGRFRPELLSLAGRADLLVLAGDLTEGGAPGDADLLYAEVRDLPVPTVAVLGNHDHDQGYGDAIAAGLAAMGVRVLDGTALTLDVRGVRVGVAGVMGGGGGFPGVGAPDLAHSPEDPGRKARGSTDARRLRDALATLDGAAVRLAVTHFAPVPDTLAGEPLEIYAGLGSHLLGEAIDEGGATFAIHGHAHSGSEYGRTPRGVPVRNVSYPVLRRAFALYEVP